MMNLSQTRQSTLVVTPETVLVGDRIEVTTAGLASGAIGVLLVSSHDQFGNVWAAVASFAADATAVIAPTQQAPVAGSYTGVDPGGWFWSMEVNLEAITTAEQEQAFAEVQAQDKTYFDAQRLIHGGAQRVGAGRR